MDIISQILLTLVGVSVVGLLSILVIVICKGGE